MTNARTITNAWVHRTLPDIFYEEREPIEDGMQQEMALERLIYLLRLRFGADPTVFMSGVVFISYDITNGNRRVAPDLFIAFGVDNAAIQENLPNYWLWEIGKVPDFVMEVASDSTAARDLNEKWVLYQSLGIAEYWRFNSKNGERYGAIMVGERLVNGVYQPYEVQVGSDGSLSCHSDLLGLDFYWDDEREFDVLDPETGRTIDVLENERTARLVAEAEAEAAHARADSADAHAQAADARIREPEAKLERERRRPG
jgi:Uma2 family endonuclease